MNDKVKMLTEELGLDFIKNEDGYFVDHGFAYSRTLETVGDLESYLLKIKVERGVCK